MIVGLLGPVVQKMVNDCWSCVQNIDYFPLVLTLDIQVAGTLPLMFEQKTIGIRAVCKKASFAEAQPSIPRTHSLHLVTCALQWGSNGTTSTTLLFAFT